MSKKFLYYPNLEPPNREWLKFAILYMEEFESIVPYRRQNLISEDYRRIEQETDLVSMYAPNYQQGYNATIKAIEEADKVLAKTYERSPLFGKVNLKREWQIESRWKHQIYREKFSTEWVDYCLENSIGKKIADGILLPKSLAFLYMTNLAKEIAYERNGSIITDNLEYDRYTNYSRVFSPALRQRQRNLKNIISLIIPRNISDISIETLIQFRNQNRDKIRAFNLQLDTTENSISDGVTKREFIEQFNNSYSELTREIIQLGLGLATIPFVAYILINNPVALKAEYAKEIIEAMGIVTAGAFAIKGAIKSSPEKRMTKKYLANLERLR